MSGPPQMGCSVGLLDGLMGNASEIEPAKIEEDFGRVLAPGSASRRRTG